ncbi:uncharacterized protein LOC134334807 [Trichomycterus rosablanca]|uniref:uncharacterized protein LOC134334807 n=1 Tax=Trichomycterus rosablanca TaxID=2290929 RepID=UPI002F351C13
MYHDPEQDDVITKTIERLGLPEQKRTIKKHHKRRDFTQPGSLVPSAHPQQRSHQPHGCSSSITDLLCTTNTTNKTETSTQRPAPPPPPPHYSPQDPHPPRLYTPKCAGGNEAELKRPDLLLRKRTVTPPPSALSFPPSSTVMSSIPPSR